MIYLTYLTILQSFHLIGSEHNKVAKGSAVQKVLQQLSYFDHMSPFSDLDLENSKPIFLHGTPAKTDAS